MFEGRARLLHMPEEALPADSAALWPALWPRCSPHTSARTCRPCHAHPLRAPDALPGAGAPGSLLRLLKPGVDAIAPRTPPPHPRNASPVLLSQTPNCPASLLDLGAEGGAQVPGHHPVSDARTQSVYFHVWGMNESLATGRGGQPGRSGGPALRGHDRGVSLHTPTFPSLPRRNLAKGSPPSARPRGMGTASTGPWAIPTWNLCWGRTERSSSEWGRGATGWAPRLRGCVLCYVGPESP